MSTIKEIARRAGVSPTTVSNVVNGNTARVSPQTRARVERLLEEANYAPNMAAHILAHNRSRIVGVIMYMEPRRDESVLEDPFSSVILGSMEAALRDHGYFMMLHTTGDEQEVLRLARAWQLSGLIVLWAPGEMVCALRESVRRPIVFVDSYLPEEPGGSCSAGYSVGLDDYRGGYEVTRYLVGMGHRDLCFMANDALRPGADSERFAGCRDALRGAGGDLADDRYVSLSKERPERLSLYERVAGAESGLSAIVFSSDYYAAEAVNHLQDIGVSIPRDVSVTGFDDNIFSRLVRPRLTTVYQDVGGKGHTAVDLLVRAAAGDDVSEPHVRLPVELRVRDSVRRLPIS